MLKKTVLAALLLLSFLAVASVEIASQYVSGLFEGRYEEVYELQDSSMKKAQPLSAIRKLQGQLLSQIGKPLAILDTQEVTQGELVSYIMATEFRAGIFDLIVTVNSEEKVAGFFVRQSSYVKSEKQPVEIMEGDALVNQYLNGFFSGKYEEIYEMQSERLKEAQTVEVLKSLHGQLKGQIGNPLQTLNVEKIENDGLMSYVMTTKFEAGVFDVTVTVDSGNMVAGFFVRPSSYSDRPLPDYADSSSYIEQDITVGSEPYYLPAKLMVPGGLDSYPLVIILQGSGTHDVDGTLGPNKPYRDIAVGLASRGIATLRYPKRYLVYPDRVAEIGTSAEAEYIEDALTVIAQMKGIPQFSGIYLAGHSMGGMVAPWIAEEAGVSGVIVLAGSPVKLAQISMDQVLDLMGDQLTQEQKDQAVEFYTQLLEQKIPAETDLGQGLTASYYYSLDRYFCMPVLENTELPVLIVNAELDFQSPAGYFDIFAQRLGDRENVTLKLLPNLNHIFNETDGTIKGIEEYDRPGYVAVELIDLLEQWVKDQK